MSSFTAAALSLPCIEDLKMLDFESSPDGNQHHFRTELRQPEAYFCTFMPQLHTSLLGF